MDNQSAGMRRMILSLGILVVSSLVASAAPGADEVMGKAKAKAAKEQKTIFVDFSASW